MQTYHLWVEHCTFSDIGNCAGARWRRPARLRPAAAGCQLPGGYPGCPPPDLSMQSRQCGASPSRQAALGGKWPNGFSTWQAPQILPSPDCTAGTHTRSSWQSMGMHPVGSEDKRAAAHSELRPGR